MRGKIDKGINIFVVRVSLEEIVISIAAVSELDTAKFTPFPINSGWLVAGTAADIF